MLRNPVPFGVVVGCGVAACGFSALEDGLRAIAGLLFVLVGAVGALTAFCSERAIFSSSPKRLPGADRSPSCLGGAPGNLDAPLGCNSRLGPYVLLGKLGEGGMGSVYAARHATTNQRAAVKLLNANGPTSRQRFEREVRLTRLLDHPHTIRVYDHGVSGDGRLYYAMECVDGVSLGELVGREGPQAPERVIHLLHQLAAGLAAVHRVGLVHRDITPGNILLGRHSGVTDWVRVLDFGLAKELGVGDAVQLTATNCVTGTPAYLAPEMITAPDRVDGRADIYGLGGVAYFLLTGAPPFSGATALEVCAHHVHTLPEPPSKRCRRAIPRSLEHLVLACLSKQPEQRPADASRLEQELLGLTRAHPWEPPGASAKGWRSAA